ncbi:hypothetical protein ANO11243_091280 [Dothideomycetidae sp. 11243]|nr:hypothetical protein ANO11243_091280 [fungal sp. No.11243]
MDEIPSLEGTIALNLPSVKTSCFTWYKTFGDLSCGKPVVIVLHGGPGSTSGLSQEFRSLWPDHGLPVVVYDQIGCGKSTNLDDEKGGDKSFWQVSLFVTELETVLDFFGLREPSSPGYHLLGSSWGAMLASELAVTQPRGLRRVILVCPGASMSLIIKGMHIRIGELPQEAQDAINEGIHTQDTTTDRFQNAYRAYIQHCVIRQDPLPQVFEGYIKWLTSKERGVNSTMLGPFPLVTEGSVGSLRGWDITPRLHQITAKTLLINGEFDQSHDICVQPIYDRIPRVRWCTIPDASHAAILEGEKIRSAFFKLIGVFLTQTETDKTTE